MYKGPWASRFVRTARAAGGLITMADLARYRAVWREPWRTSYRGYTLHTCSGRTFGGLWTLLGLKALEHADLRRLGHWSRAADALEMVTRTIRQVWEESWLLDYRLLDDAEFVTARLTSRHGARIWKKIAKALPLSGRAMPGSHSYHVIVRDRDGNVASGTNTHESLAWGSGLFVDGVVLPTSGYLPWGTRPGERRISPFAMTFAFQQDALRFAAGSFSSSIAEASLQLVLNLIDYRCRAEVAVTLPRVGTFPHNPAAFLSNIAAEARAGAVDPGANWLDPRLPSRVVAAVERRGLAFVPDAAGRRRAARRDATTRRAEVDTGLGAVLTVGPGGKAEGATTPWSGMPKPVDD
jgi:gamma-glutamyltranspeptidase/glutathione hydrolase